METSSHNLSIKFESAAPAASYAANGFVFTFGAMTFNQIMMLIGSVSHRHLRCQFILPEAKGKTRAGAARS